jgi:hypothetical protein
MGFNSVFKGLNETRPIEMCSWPLRYITLTVASFVASHKKKRTTKNVGKKNWNLKKDEVLAKWR